MDEIKSNKNTNADDCGQFDAIMRDTAHSSDSSWRCLYRFTTKNHTWSFALAMLFSVISGMIIPALAVFLRLIFEAFTKYGGQSISGSDLVKQTSAYGKGLVALGCISGLLNAVFFMCWIIFGELQARGARGETFDKMLDKNMAWIDTRSFGVEALVSQLQIRIRELQLATSQPLGFLMQYTVTVVTALGIAVYYSWSVTLFTLGTAPFSTIFLNWISKRMQPAIQAQNARIALASSAASNAIAAIETVKCFNGQKYELSKYTEFVDEAARFSFVQARSSALQTGFVRLAILVMFVQGFWYGTHLVNTGQQTPGHIMTCFWACLIAIQTVEQTLPQIVVLQKGRSAGVALAAVATKVEDNKRSPELVGGEAPSHCQGVVELKNVSFSYPSRPDQLALNGSSFFFPSGKTTYVVGKSGSGKSTISNLLMRFYNPEAGEISIDGRSIQQLDINWLRSNMTLVQQRSVLFNDTIYGNIACGQRYSNPLCKVDLQEAIDMACLQHTIKDLPQGVDTIVGAAGNAMSGGQRQRVALARALVRDTPILILDEATSALDHATKSAVLERTSRWRAGKTTIIITHDLSQIPPDGFVYVLDHGTVVHEGLWKSLAEDCKTGSFSWLFKNSDQQISTSTAKPCVEEATLTTESANVPLSSSHDSVDIDVVPQEDCCSSLASPTTSLALHERRASRCSTSSGPPATPLQHDEFFATSNTDGPKFPSLDLQRPSAEYIGVPPMVLGDEDIEMQPLMRRSESSSTLVDEVSERSHRPGKAGRDVKDFKARPVIGILMTIWPTLPRPKRVILVLGFAAAFIHAASTPIFSFVFSKLLSTFFLGTTDARANQAYIYSLYILGVAVVDSIASYFMQYLLESCGQHWIDSLRIRAFRNILDQPMAFFSLEENRTEKLMETLDRNAEETRNLLGRFAALVFVAITMMTIAVVWSLFLSWQLTLVSIICAPFLYSVTRGFESISNRWESRSNNAASSANAIFSETFNLIRTVRAYTLEGHFRRKYEKATVSAFHTGVQRAIYSGLFFGLSDTCTILVTALIFYYGAYLVSTGVYNVPDILAVFTTLLFSISHVNGIVALIPQIASSCTTATELFRLVSLPFEASTTSTKKHQPTSIDSIRFDRVTFTYPSSHNNPSPTFTTPTKSNTQPPPPIINNLTLTLNPHTSTALTGPSGTGKSTLASLLMGLHTPSSGTIFINEIPLSQIHIPTLRSLISIVPQHPIVFAGLSVGANISYPDDIDLDDIDLDDIDLDDLDGDDDDDDQLDLERELELEREHRIRTAARLSGIHDFIATLPDGYRTILGPGSGSSSPSSSSLSQPSNIRGGGGIGHLSGGQIQRLALARALYHHSITSRTRTGLGIGGRGLLILDEPTSALDNAAAAKVKNLISPLPFFPPLSSPHRHQRDGQENRREKKMGEMGYLVITHDWSRGGMVDACGDVIRLL